MLAAADGEDEEEADAAGGDEAPDAAADAPTDAAAAAAGQPGSDSAAHNGGADAGTAASAASTQQHLGRSDSAADSNAFWSALLRARWEGLRRDELESLEQHQVGLSYLNFSMLGLSHLGPE